MYLTHTSSQVRLINPSEVCPFKIKLGIRVTDNYVHFQMLLD